MDKEWMHLSSRLVPEYEVGVKKFIEQARSFDKTREVILCPCNRCKNKKYKEFDQVYEDLIMKGMDPSYTTWIFHVETTTSQSQGECSLKVHEDRGEHREAYHLFRDAFVPDEEVNTGGARDQEFTDSYEDAETPLYPSCTAYTKLSASITLYNHKSTNGQSDKSLDELLDKLGDMLPEKNTLPKSVYEMKQLLKPFDLGYEKIHACPNDCCLFRNELKDMNSCPKCGSSRWKVDKVTKKVQKRVLVKVLRYFPLIPRLKRLFRSQEKAEQLIWHSNNKSQEHKMRHPVDSVAWDTINQKWPTFASDPRNIRLGLSTDGFNPFGDLSSRHSCWPVILVIYNLPPWICMSKENLMLTLLIPGPKQPGNNIDVYLETLIEDLKELWDRGVQGYDALNKTVFNLKAILMWTISDFPAYGNLAGCPTKGKFACPICGEGVCSMWLKYSRKFAYLGHRRFLAPDHPFRQKKKWFNGKKESMGRPRPLTGKEVLNAMKDIKNDWGKKLISEPNGTKKRKEKKQGSYGSKKDQNSVPTWKKKSIFFDFPYWSDIVLRHNLDVMHVEKNVCDNIIGTLLNLKHKSKDDINARNDLVHLKIRKELHPQEKGKNAYHLPAAPCTLSKKEADIFCSRLKKIKLPDGYSSNIGNCVSLEERKIIGLKSHDCHVLMQQLLSVALRGLLPKGPRNAIFLLSAFYNELCQRVIDRNRLEQLEESIAETLCMFERYFPPAFFTISVHLTIHLAREARLCGPIQFRWMYPFERFMKVLKVHVRNRARPEGCIAECYLAEERLRFCSAYFKKADNIGVRPNRNADFENEQAQEGREISQGKEKILDDHMLQAAHRYVLFNTAEVEPYLQEHVEELKQTDSCLSSNETLLRKRHMETFAEWFSKHRPDSASNRIIWLAYGPRKHVLSYTGYVINGHRYHTIDVERSTQDSGVSVEGDTLTQCSDKGDSQTIERLSYYGVIRDILLLDYYSFKVTLFRCDWANPSTGIKMEDGFTLVNLHQGLKAFESDPFILASQAKQVFYSKDNDDSNWYVLMKVPPRGIHDMDLLDQDAYTTSAPLDVSKLGINVCEKEPYARDECEGIDVTG